MTESRLLFVKIAEKFLTTRKKYGILYKERIRISGKEARYMRPYTAPEGVWLPIDEESILATADSGVLVNAGVDNDNSWGKLTPPRHG